MKEKINILYVGNFLARHGMNPNFNIYLTPRLAEHYTVIKTSDKKNKFLRLFDMLWACYKNRKYVDVVIIDVFSTSAFYFAYLVAAFCRSLRIPYINVLHGGNLPFRLKKNPGLCKSLFNYSAKNASPSYYLEEAFKKEGYDAVYIPNFIAIDTYSFKHRTKAEAKILWVRSMHEVYNPGMAVTVLKCLMDANIDAHLCMVGPDKDGSLAMVKSLATELNVTSHLKITGRLSLEEWTELSSEYDIFINTTNFDNHPVSLIEAMALGFPIISTNVGGVPYLIHDQKDGLLVPANDHEAMAEKITYLINNPLICSELSANARKEAEQFDWKVVKDLWIKTITTSIKK